MQRLRNHNCHLRGMLWRETDETMHQTILTFQRFEHCQYDLVSQSTGLLLVVILTMSSSSNSVMSAAEILKGAKNLFSDFGYIHSFYYVLVSSWHAMRILCFFGASCKQKKLCLNWQIMLTNFVGVTIPS